MDDVQAIRRLALGDDGCAGLPGARFAELRQLGQDLVGLFHPCGLRSWVRVLRRLVATVPAAARRFTIEPKAMLNKSTRVWAPWFGMGCKARTTAIAQLWRGFATPQTAQNRGDRAAMDLFSVALT